mgnify:CR=1 FL=1
MVLLLNTNSTDSVACGSAVRHTEDAAPIINELLTFVCSGTSHSSWDTIEDIVTRAHFVLYKNAIAIIHNFTEFPF